MSAFFNDTPANVRNGHENYVQVNIWLPTQGNCGHVSVFTSNLKSKGGCSSRYYSLWPKGKGSEAKAIVSDALGIRDHAWYITNRNARYQASYEDDVRQEDGKEADVRIKLYTLDMDKLEIEAERMIERQVGNFRLLGSTAFDRFCAKAIGFSISENCTSFAYQLLEAAEIGKLTKLEGNIDQHDRRLPWSSGSSSGSSAIKEPKALAKMVVDAKICELESEKSSVTDDYDTYWRSQGHGDTIAYTQRNKFNREDRAAQEQRHNSAPSNPR